MNELNVLYLTAASIGFFHTLIGPDHYLPFIVIQKARNWRLKKTLLLTFLCGLGHVLSSVVLGFIGIAFGIMLAKLELFESIRGSIASWAFISFGFLYMIWGIKKAINNKPHSHLHGHDGGALHSHTHSHAEDHVHIHDNEKKNITPWVLFIIFVLGPCEPLIPILMYPAANNSIVNLIAVTSVFAITTIGTMMAVVALGSLGLSLVPLKRFERFSHASAGFAILASGLAMQFLGL